MERLQHRDLMDLERDVLSTMLWDADSQNGELYLRLEMDAHLNNQLMRQPTLLLDMDLYANKMVSFQLLNQRSFKMENTILRYVLKFLKEFSVL